jgi:hypothetical protein
MENQNNIKYLMIALLAILVSVGCTSRPAANPPSIPSPPTLNDALASAEVSCNYPDPQGDLAFMCAYGVGEKMEAFCSDQFNYGQKPIILFFMLSVKACSSFLLTDELQNSSTLTCMVRAGGDYFARVQTYDFDHMYENNSKEVMHCELDILSRGM